MDSKLIDVARLDEQDQDRGGMSSQGAAIRKCIRFFEEDARTEQCASMISGLGYRPVDGRGDQTEDACVAVLINTQVDPDLTLARKQSARHRVILLADETSFEFKLAAARAGVEAILSTPLDTVELGAWLDDYDTGEAEPLSILIVDDDEIAAEAFAFALEAADMRARILTDPSRVLEEISSNTPDLILLDMHMPVADGMEVAQIIRQSRRNLSLPIIFLSAEQDVERQRQARKLGGDDFINKSVGFDHLASLVRMRAERAVALRQIGERDSLTGLLNHARFKDRVAVELERCRRTGSQFSVCLLDIDHFKQVNDTKGHQVGDRVIQTLSHSLVGGLRHIDVVARYGGEEFGVILLDTPIEPSNAVMNRIREHFADIPMRGPDEPFHVTFSAGVAGADAGKSADELIAAADAALYEAKRSGRNRVVSAKS
ncbi:GGDEF domain-containing protein [Aurantimonas sp. A3-2-R12]|uniref:GGDEF domain-containing protein n=1 Tax=Aurantimonas sp. A3-2-R12 TaxID=3114362 RepID=UPI002E175190|nr:diguanylate cyclase [Aurantimonas sp. A3-2-R12]